MKLTDVVVSTNLNRLYLDFVPIFIKAWRTLFPEIRIHILLIAKKIPEDLKKYTDDIVLFKPIEGVSDVFVSQFIRILYPCICEADGGILTTDMDMMPMNTRYYTKPVDALEDDCFAVFRRPFFWKRRLQTAICYNMATKETWKKVFGLDSWDDIRRCLKEEYKKVEYDGTHGGIGWDTDQLVLYKKLMDWFYKKGGKPIVLGDKLTGYKRLDRIHKIEKSETLAKEIQDGVYSDYHMRRPYKDHKELNDWICGHLRKN